MTRMVLGRLFGLPNGGDFGVRSLAGRAGSAPGVLRMMGPGRFRKPGVCPGGCRRSGIRAVRSETGWCMGRCARGSAVRPASRVPSRAAARK